MGPFSTDLLKGKVVLITGGATGLGRAMGEKFLALGASLAIASRRDAVLEKAAEEMSLAAAAYSTKAVTYVIRFKCTI